MLRMSRGEIAVLLVRTMIVFAPSVFVARTLVAQGVAVGCLLGVLFCERGWRPVLSFLADFTGRRTGLLPQCAVCSNLVVGFGGTRIYALALGLSLSSSISFKVLLV